VQMRAEELRAIVYATHSSFWTTTR
jgi:hypothetical protein